MATVIPGIETLAGERADLVRGRKLGLLANPTAVDRSLRHGLDLLREVDADCVRVLFGPEHGFWAQAQDMEPVAGSADEYSGLPVYSLYGDTLDSLKPRAEWLSGLDAVVYDIQDVGSRYYTFIYTLAFMISACAEAGVQVIVCDRPNPIGGAAVEGMMLRPGYESFVGAFPLPNRHGLTAGEFARYYASETGLDVDLEVIPCAGWSREQMFGETGLPWVQPSPNMPTPDTALVYPGMCLVEGTELSEGRGTTRPFEYFGAPGMDPFTLARRLNGLGLSGVAFRPAWFAPTFQKHAGENCGGVALHVTEPAAFRPYLTGLVVLTETRRLFPEAFAWRTRAYEFVDDKPAIELLLGCPDLLDFIEQGAAPADFTALMEPEERDWSERRRQWLIYE